LTLFDRSIRCRRRVGRSKDRRLLLSHPEQTSPDRHEVDTQIKRVNAPFRSPYHLVEPFDLVADARITLEICFRIVAELLAVGSAFGSFAAVIVASLLAPDRRRGAWGTIIPLSLASRCAVHAADVPFVIRAHRAGV
jgi:hypothetical protein